MTTPRYNLSALMTNAWSIVRTEGLTLSAALRRAWATAKAQLRAYLVKYAKPGVRAIAQVLEQHLNSCRLKGGHSVNLWERAGRSRLYINGAGYNTSKCSTKVYIDLVDGCKVKAFVDCPGQSTKWCMQRREEMEATYAWAGRFVRLYGDLSTK